MNRKTSSYSGWRRLFFVREGGASILCPKMPQKNLYPPGEGLRREMKIDECF
ncbi:hypothetical protein HMPREF0262_02207 [Clostridium sp. ATCC 29733]|nr:hypothetical protein HMPREF0262_02207 [Clostridium sp. ATCC 29733]